MDKKKYLRSWAETYKNDLTNNIMPFWLNHGWDKENGGIYTCLDRDGSLMDTTKSVWFQGRWAFICAFAYNNVEKNQEWLEASKSAIDFIEKHCFDEDGHMYFEVTAEGKPLRKRRYVFSETFAAIAFAEYSLATGDKHYAERALQVFHDAQRFLSTPGFLPAKYEAGVEMQSHSIIMILINVGSRLRAVIDDPTLTQQIDESISLLRRYFMHPEFKALLETVGPKGEFIDTNAARTSTLVIVLRPHGLSWRKLSCATGIKTYSTPPSPSSIGRGTGDGTRNLAASSTSATAKTCRRKTMRKT